MRAPFSESLDFYALVFPDRQKNDEHENVSYNETGEAGKKTDLFPGCIATKVCSVFLALHLVPA